MGVLSHAVPTYIGAVLLLAVVLAAMGWRSHPLNHGDLVPLVVLCVMGILSDSVREKDVGRRTGLSFTSIVSLSSVALLGPFGAAVVGAVPHLLGVNKERAPVRGYHAGMAAAHGAIAGCVYARDGERQAEGTG